MAQQVYLYRSDDGATASTPSNHLTPRAYFYAENRAEAVAKFQQIEKARHPHGRVFGKAAVTKAPAKARLDPWDYLPDLETLYGELATYGVAIGGSRSLRSIY